MDITAAYFGAILVLLLSVISASPLHAQVPPARIRPYVKPPPAGTSWTIDIKQVPKNPKKPAPITAAPTDKPEEKMLPGVVPVRMESEYGQNQIRHDVTIYSDKHRDESYTMKGQMLRKYDGSDKVAVLQPNPAFPGLDWLASGSVYVSTETVANKECHKFRVSPEYLASVNWPADSQYFAWISVADRYPVQVQAEECMYTFSDITPYPKDVPLPDEYKSAIEQASRTQRALEIMRSQNVR